MDKEPQNCWEFENCPEETTKKCPAFLYPDEKCWHIASSPDGAGYPKTKGMGLMFCVTKCEWYKKLNPNVDKKP